MTKGRVSIELTDVRTGDKKEVKARNFISQGAKKMMENRARGVFMENIRDVGYPLQHPTLNPFDLLQLTDATTPEDPVNECLPIGNTIGQAYATNASVPAEDKTFGTLNVAETVVTPEKVRLVFDFPTDRGNGTFSSVLFRSLPTASDGTPGLPTPNLLDASKVEVVDGFIYAAYTNALRKFNMDYQLIEQVTINSLTDFTVCDEYIYVTRNNANVYKYDKADLQATPEQFATPTIRVYGITSNPNGRIVCLANMGSNKYSLVAFAADWTGLETITDDVNLSTTLSYYPLNRVDVNYIARNVMLSNKSVLFGGTANAQKRIAGFTPSGVFIFISGTMFLCPIPFLGSRVLLDEPVTKTENQVMKIIYEFIMPPYLS